MSFVSPLKNLLHEKKINLFLGCLCLAQVLAQNSTLHLTCNQTLEDSLECCFTLGDNFGYKKKIYYPAVYNSDKTECYFTFPDSVYQRFFSFNLIKHSKPSTHCSFTVMNENDTLSASGILFWEKTDTMTLDLQYKDKIKYKNMFNHLYLVNYIIMNPSQETTLSLYCYDSENRSEVKTAQEKLYNYYKQLILQYSDSRSVLCRLYENHRLLTIEQLEQLKSLFSEKLLQTYWGKELTALIDSGKGKFKNNLFLNSRTGEQESVILNPDKHSFVIFSASWCAPCHKLIPLLKELYSKKKDVMDFVYISLDEQKTQNAWKQLLEKEQIPWRALCG